MWKKVEKEESSTLSGVEPTGSLQEMYTVTEGKDSIISVLLSRIKQHKYFVLDGLGIVMLMVVLIPLFNQKGKVGDSESSKIETASLIATSSSVISSETDLDLSESSLSSANNRSI